MELRGRRGGKCPQFFFFLSFWFRIRAHRCRLQAAGTDPDETFTGERAAKYFLCPQKAGRRRVVKLSDMRCLLRRTLDRRVCSGTGATIALEVVGLSSELLVRAAISRAYARVYLHDKATSCVTGRVFPSFCSMQTKVP